MPIGAFGDQANITDVAASIHQNQLPVSNNEHVTTEKETTMSNEISTAVEATIPTPALPATARRRFDLPTAGEYMAAYHIGGESFRNVQAAVKDFVLSKQSALQAAKR